MSLPSQQLIIPSPHLHHVLLLREKAIKLEVLFSRSLLRPQAEYRLPTQLFLAASHIGMQVVQQLANVFTETQIHNRSVNWRKLLKIVEWNTSASGYPLQNHINIKF